MTTATTTPQEEERLARERVRKQQKAARARQEQSRRARQVRTKARERYERWQRDEARLHGAIIAARLSGGDEARARGAWLAHWRGRPTHPSEVDA